MSIRLVWLWTKWLWNSSGCGYDRCIPGTSPMLKTSVGIVSAWKFSFSVDFEFQRGKPDPIQFLKEMQ